MDTAHAGATAASVGGEAGPAAAGRPCSNTPVSFEETVRRGRGGVMSSPAYHAGARRLLLDEIVERGRTMPRDTTDRGNVLAPSVDDEGDVSGPVGPSILEEELWRRSLMMAEIIEQGRTDDVAPGGDRNGGGGEADDEAESDNVLDSVVEDLALQRALVMSELMTIAEPDLAWADSSGRAHSSGNVLAGSSSFERLFEGAGNGRADSRREVSDRSDLMAEVLSSTRERRREADHAEETAEATPTDAARNGVGRRSLWRVLSDIRLTRPPGGASFHRGRVSEARELLAAAFPDRRRQPNVDDGIVANFEQHLEGILQARLDAPLPPALPATDADDPPRDGPRAWQGDGGGWQHRNGVGHVDLMAEIVARAGGESGVRSSSARSLVAPEGMVGDSGWRSTSRRSGRGPLLAEIASRAGDVRTAGSRTRRRRERTERMAQMASQMSAAARSLSGGLLRGASDEEPPSDEKQACIVCWEMPRSHAFIPCGHRCVCRGCAWKMGRAAHSRGYQCPICRRVATDVIKIFL